MLEPLVPKASDDVTFWLRDLVRGTRRNHAKDLVRSAYVAYRGDCPTINSECRNAVNQDAPDARRADTATRALTRPHCRTEEVNSQRRCRTRAYDYY